MLCPTTEKSIRDVNAAYLFLAQRLLALDLDAGIFRLGIDRALANRIMELSVAQIHRLSECRIPLCQLRLTQSDVFTAFCQASESADQFPVQAATMLADTTTLWPTSHDT